MEIDGVETSRMVFGGQEVFTDSINKFLYIWIREPYYSAGKRHGWDGSPIGLGLNKHIIEYALRHGYKLRVFVGNRSDRAYQADPSQWLDFAQRYGAIYYANGVPVYLLQWSTKHFETVRDDPALAVAGELLQEEG